VAGLTAATALFQCAGMLDAYVTSFSPINIADGIAIILIAVCIYLAWKSK
jgi:hypothetical protein